MKLIRQLSAEFIGTFWLVLGGCGSAVFAANIADANGVNNFGLGYLGVSLAFGFTVVTGAYALGHISGGHFNPAVTLGLVAGGKFSPSNVVQYIAAQVLGAFAAGLAIYAIAKGNPEWGFTEGAGDFATNGFGSLSPSGFSMGAVFLAEVILTAIFLIIILGATSKAASAAMGGLAIGLTLALIHMISIPISNTSVNPARSTSQAVVKAIFDGGSEPMGQLWLFWVAPIIGAIIGGLIYRSVLDGDNAVD